MPAAATPPPAHPRRAGAHLFVERQLGVLEVHGDDRDDVLAAGRAILAGLGADESDRLQPQVLYSDVIDDVTDSHAVIVNRTREASVLLPAGPCSCTR